MNVLLIGECHSDNIGDVAIAEGLSHALKRNGCIVTCADYSVRGNYHDKERVRYSDNFSLKKVIVNFAKRSAVGKAVLQILWISRNYGKIRNIVTANSYSLAVIGGGQLILSNGTFPGSFWCWSRALSKGKIKTVMLSVGLGDKFSFFDRMLISRGLENVTKVYCRDRTSLSVLSKTFGRDGLFSADGAYGLPVPVMKGKTVRDTDPERILIMPVDYEVYRRYAPEMNERALPFIEYLEVWREIIDKELSNGKFVTLGSTTERDFVITKSIYKKWYALRQEVTIVEMFSSVQACQELLHEGISKVISGRMHGLILAHIHGVQSEPFVLSQKVKRLSEEYLSASVCELNNQLDEVTKLLVKT